MQHETTEQLRLLQTRHRKLHDAASAVRAAQKAYYTYRPQSDMDMQRKQELLQESKRREKELDQILHEEQTGQQNLF